MKSQNASAPDLLSDDAVIEIHPSIPPLSENRLGRYRLCSEVASGGMATVYLARVDGPAGFDKMVALKRIHPHLAREKNFVEMFLDEARIAARINHPNVCHVFDFGESAGSYYIAMEYLLGEPLSRLLKAIWLQPWQKDSPRLPMYASRIVADACEGLHAAHELRDSDGELMHVVHRDVSPHNLFVTFQGGVRVVDFGIASARNRLHQTNTGEVKGKFAYMAPEQLRGKAVDRRADVWSLGIVLWEMVTMKRLFRRNTEMETIFAVASDTIPRPSDVRPSVPRELEDMIMKALSRDPDQRYPSARDFGRDLLRFLSSRNDLVGPADLADWMDELFPNGEEEKLSLLEAARNNKSERPIDLPRTEDDSPSQSNILSIVDSEAIRHMSQPSRVKRNFKWLAIAAAIAVFLGIVAGAAEHLREAFKEPQRPITPVAKPKPPWRATPPPVVIKPPAEVETPTEPPPSKPRTHHTSHRPHNTTKENREPDTKKPTPAVKPATKGIGVVNVATPGGWAYVLENGQRLGQTPVRLTLPAGHHTLEIRPFGEPPSTKVNVDVKPDEVERISIRIE